jgi:uncharacterized protein
MARALRTLLFLLLLPLATGAQAASAQAPTCPASDPPLWEVIHDGAPLHLLGSVHVLRPEAYPLDDSLMELFDQAEVVVFELDLGDLQRQAMMMMEQGTYQDGRTLAGKLPEEAYQDVVDRLQALGIPSAMVTALKPWMAALMLSSLAVQQGGYEAEWGLDLHLHARAVEAGKALEPLETAEEQIQVFEGLSEEAQVAYLLSTLEELDDAVARMDEMSMAWRAGDADHLVEMILESMEDSPELTERILFQRNRNWIGPIEALLQDPRAGMVIVGTGHLVGEGSVVELLEARGHRVERRSVGCFTG